MTAEHEARPMTHHTLETPVTEAQVLRVFKDIESKRRATHYLHARPLLIEPVEEV